MRQRGDAWTVGKPSHRYECRKWRWVRESRARGMMGRLAQAAGSAGTGMRRRQVAMPAPAVPTRRLGQASRADEVAPGPLRRFKTAGSTLSCHVEASIRSRSRMGPPRGRCGPSPRESAGWRSSRPAAGRSPACSRPPGPAGPPLARPCRRSAAAGDRVLIGLQGPPLIRGLHNRAGCARPALVEPVGEEGYREWTRGCPACGTPDKITPSTRVQLTRGLPWSGTRRGEIRLPPDAGGCHVEADEQAGHRRRQLDPADDCGGACGPVRAVASLAPGGGGGFPPPGPSLHLPLPQRRRLAARHLRHEARRPSGIRGPYRPIATSVPGCPSARSCPGSRAGCTRSPSSARCTTTSAPTTPAPPTPSAAIRPAPTPPSPPRPTTIPTYGSVVARLSPPGPAAGLRADADLPLRHGLPDAQRRRGLAGAVLRSVPRRPQPDDVGLAPLDRRAARPGGTGPARRRDRRTAASTARRWPPARPPRRRSRAPLHESTAARRWS